MDNTNRSILGNIRAFLASSAPTEEQDALALSLMNFLTILYVISFALGILGAVLMGGFDQQSLISTMTKGGPIVVVLAIAQGAARSGHRRAGSTIMVVGIWINTFYQAYIANGGVASPEFGTFMVVVVLSGLMLGQMAFLITSATAFLAGILLFVLGAMGKLPLAAPASSSVPFVFALFRLINVVGMLFLFLRRLNETLQKMREMNAQLASSGQILESRVAERTRALTLSSEVSRRISTILDQDQLVREVVNQIQSAFHFYHVQVYLFDGAMHNLVLAGGTGEVGLAMLAQGHKLAAGRGLVGRAASTGEPVLVSNTLINPAWLPNTLLPDTRSELAVPMIVGSQVLGVLDVQHDIENGLTQADVDIIQSIANQVAVAVQNARTYTDAQRRAEYQAAVANLGQRIQQTASVDDVLKVAVSELGQILGARRSSVELHPQGSPTERQN